MNELDSREEGRRARISLPQVNGGDVRSTLDALLKPGPDQISPKWLEDQNIRHQPNQAWSMLKFINAIRDGKIDPELAKSRTDPVKFAERLAQLAADAYSDKIGGGRAAWNWLGRDALPVEKINKNLANKRPFPAEGHEHEFKKLKGGTKQAYYCLRALHDWLLKKRHSVGSIATNVRRENTSRTPSRSRVASKPTDPTLHMDRTPDAAIFAGRASGLSEARQNVAAQLFSDDILRVIAGNERHSVRVSLFCNDQGEPVHVHIEVDGCEYSAKVHRISQKSMADETRDRAQG